MKYKNSKASETLFQPDRIPHVASLLFFLYFLIKSKLCSRKGQLQTPQAHLCIYREMEQEDNF